MGFFKYLANILEHLNLNGCFIHEDSGNKTANVVSMAFAGFYYSNGDISVNIVEQLMKKHFELRIFFKKLCHYISLVRRHQNFVYASPKEV